MNNEGYTRIVRVKLRSAFYRPQWRKRKSDPWQMVFVSPFRDRDQADYFRRAEYPMAVHE